MAVDDSSQIAMGTSRAAPVGRQAVSIAVATLLGLACGDGPGAPPNLGSTSDGADSASNSTAIVATAADATASADTTADSTGAVLMGWMPSLDVGDDVGALFSVWGPSPELVYAAASQPLDGGLSRGALYRWDGADWSARPLPPDTPGLNWVYGIGTRRFLVGELGVILVRDGDEGEWTRYDCETILPLWGVWGISPDDVWAVGGDGFNRDPIACHFDGETWTPEVLPEPSFETHALFKVWGTASDDVWSVGDEGLLMHWQGEAVGWVEVPSGTDSDLISLWGTGPDEIVAVGGRTEAVVARFDGRAWSVRDEPELLGLNGVWVAADGTATVVGPLGGAGVVAPGSLQVEIEDSGTPLALHGVFGFDGIERWAVGGSLDMAPPYVGIALRRMP